MNHFLSFFKDVTDVWIKWKFVRTEGSYEGPPATKNHEAGQARRWQNENGKKKQKKL